MSNLSDRLDVIRQEVEDSALIFYSLAEKLEAIRIYDHTQEDFQAVLDSNMFFWRYTANYLPTEYWREIPAKSLELVDSISKFMMKVGAIPHNFIDADVLRKMAKMNLQMCDHILATMPDEDMSEETLKDFPATVFAIVYPRDIAAAINIH